MLPRAATVRPDAPGPSPEIRNPSKSRRLRCTASPPASDCAPRNDRWQRAAFRVGSVGQLFLKDVEALLTAMEESLAELGIEL